MSDLVAWCSSLTPPVGLPLSAGIVGWAVDPTLAISFEESVEKCETVHTWEEGPFCSYLTSSSYCRRSSFRARARLRVPGIADLSCERAGVAFL